MNAELARVLIHGLDTQEAIIELGNAGVEIEHVLPVEGIDHQYLTFTPPDDLSDEWRDYLEQYRPRIIEMVTTIISALEKGCPGGRPPGAISVVAMMNQLANSRKAKQATD